MADSSAEMTVYGVRFDALDEDAVVRRILQDLAERRGGCLVTPNVDILRQVAGDPGLAELLDEATLVVNDGAPIEWAARIARQPVTSRVPGATLLTTLTAAAAADGRSVMMLGGRPGAGEAANRALRELHPDLVAFAHCPPFGFENDPEQFEAVAAAIACDRPDIVFCGFGFPKQERVMVELAPRFPETWFMGCGGSIDFAGGLVSRAPVWMQRVGIEWVFRLAVEPRRLARRYLVDGLPFAARLMAWAVGERRRQRGSSRSGRGAAGAAETGRRAA